MKIRSVGLDELLDEVGYVLGGCRDLESRIGVALARTIYRFARVFKLALLRRGTRRGL